MTLSSLKIIISEMIQNMGLNTLKPVCLILLQYWIYFPVTYDLINKVIYDFEDCKRFRIPRGALYYETWTQGRCQKEVEASA